MVLIELGAVILGVTNKLGGLHRGSPISLNKYFMDRIGQQMFCYQLIKTVIGQNLWV